MRPLAPNGDAPAEDAKLSFGVSDAEPGFALATAPNGDGDPAALPKLSLGAALG